MLDLLAYLKSSSKQNNKFKRKKLICSVLLRYHACMRKAVCLGDGHL